MSLKFHYLLRLVYCALWFNVVHCANIPKVETPPTPTIECVVTQQDFERFKWRCHPECEVALTTDQLPAPMTGMLPGKDIWYFTGGQHNQTNLAMYKDFTDQDYDVNYVYFYMEYYNGIQSTDQNSDMYVMPIEGQYITFLPTSQGYEWSRLFVKLDPYYVQEYSLETGIFNTREGDIMLLRQLIISWGAPTTEDFIVEFCKSQEVTTTTTTPTPTPDVSTTVQSTPPAISTTLSSTSTFTTSNPLTLPPLTSSSPSSSQTDDNTVSSYSPTDTTTSVSTENSTSTPNSTDTTTTDSSWTTVLPNSTTTDPAFTTTTTTSETIMTTTTTEEPFYGVECIKNLNDFERLWGSHPPARLWTDYASSAVDDYPPPSIPPLDDENDKNQIWCVEGDEASSFIYHQLSVWKAYAGLTLDQIVSMTIKIQHYFHEPGSYCSFYPTLSPSRDGQKRQFLSPSTEGIWSEDVINIVVSDAKAYQVEGNSNYMRNGSYWCFKKMVIVLNGQMNPSDFDSC